MLRKLLIAVAFVTAFSFVGVGTTDSANAWWGRRPYVSYYAPPPVYYNDYYGGYAPYRTYYAPRIVRPYAVYYGSPDYYYYGPRSGVSVSVGF